MQTLTGAVLIAAAGIFWLVALQARYDDGLQLMGGGMACLLGVTGMVFFIGGLFRDISPEQKRPS